MIILSEVKSERERQISYDIICMWALKKKHKHTQMYLSIKQKQTHRTREQTCDCQGQGGHGTGGMDWEFGIGGCKLLCIAWINNKVLLYSMGSYIQHPVINRNGKESEKECTYV